MRGCFTGTKCTLSYHAAKPCYGLGVVTSRRAFRQGRAAFSAFALACLVVNAARANGAFPSASQLVHDPKAPDHLFLTTTFGLLVTEDAGANWDWVCEAGMGYRDVQAPIAVLPGGAIVLAVPGGVSLGDATGCDFRPIQDFDGIVLDVARVPSEPDGVVALSGSGAPGKVWRSKDGGSSFAPLGDPLAGVIPLTIDVAATDANVIYVSGYNAGGGLLLRSKDGGKSFDGFPIPNTSTAHRPFIAAVDPNDANTVYVRLDGTPSMLEVTHDGGTTFTTALSTLLPALGFALSPDGKTVIASNFYDGTFRASTDTLDFQKVGCLGPSCLDYAPSGLFGCGDNQVDGYIVGRSDDVGATFQRVVDLSCIRGPLACDPQTSVGSQCPSAWPYVAAQIGATTCAPADLPVYTSCLGGAGGDDGAPSTTGGSGGKSVTTPKAPTTHAHDSGCGCRIEAARAVDAGSVFGWIALGMGALRRKARRFGRVTRESRNEAT